MLRIEPKARGGYPHIRIDGVPAKAWIEHKPWRHGSTDWTLWYERQGRLARGKCQLRLEIESRLRSWLLLVSGMPLHALTYAEPRLITEGRIPEARRLHARGRDTLMRRPDTPPVPYLSS